ncbi:MAG: type II toxin-antitoxin system HicB family antitoxin [Candidatus Bipolaricaulota bacterium]|nr:type II toxin-antitoxin system HicB family antitoxin [Candidatus Bipolaricaulota bacterium]MDW8141202.1 type II toxin-antitoxin system HicB family antitoxin [Candidatus Bipolaricaulota bacterium]MDW8329824.1 type II toxin-antitoxin system HicB family antitoxin [Candidatus Bipolaricaulota bacterium]
MLIEYIERAMSKAKYKKLEDGTYCGTIRPCVGVIAFGSTLDECQEELRSSLEDWLMAKLRHGQPIPIIDGIDLNVKVPDKVSARS